MTIFETVRSRSSPRNHLACLRMVPFLILGVLLLSSSMFAEIHEKPFVIGALALGPRVVPVWHCGPGEYRSPVAEPRHETIPTSVTGLRDELANSNMSKISPRTRRSLVVVSSWTCGWAPRKRRVVSLRSSPGSG